MPFDRDIEVGGMIEIPAAVLALGAFLRSASISCRSAPTT